MGEGTNEQQVVELLRQGANSFQTTRVVVWDRYDLVGIFRVDEDGSWRPAPLLER